MSSTNASVTDMCASGFLQDTVFPYTSGIMFGLLSLSAFVAFVLVLLRRDQIRHALLRALFFALLALASACHVGIGLVHAIMSIGKEDTIYNRLQNTYFATLSLAVNVVNLLLILPAPKSSWWRRWGIFAMSCSLCGVVIHLGFVIGMPNLWDMRIAWVISDVFCLFALIFSIQAAALSKSHIRELALLTAAAAAFVLRYVPEVCVAIYIISAQDRHLTFDGNSLYELFLEIFPTVVVLAVVWPRKNVLLDKQASAKGWIERFLRERGLSVAILCFFYLFVGFIFVNGLLDACSGPFGFFGWSFYIASGASRVLAHVVPLLLFTVMFGSMTFLKSTVLKIVVPFDDAITWHLHVAGVFMVFVLMHLVSSVLIGYDASFDLMPWATGGVGFGLGALAFFAGIVYWVGAHTPMLGWFSFPRFIWLHRLGYLMILLMFPIHIWSSMLANPFGYVLAYAVYFMFLVELLWRVGHLARSSECRITVISQDLYWLDVEINSSRKQQLYKSGQWVYLTVPKLSIFERHPFTIASVVKRSSSSSFVLASDRYLEDERLLEDDGEAGPEHGTTLRFLIKKQNGRGERSWTYRLHSKLTRHEHLSVYVDGPFSSPAMNVASRTVRRALLIGVGSGITAPLGIAAGLEQPWTSIVFVSRDPAQVLQIAGAVHAIIAADERALRGSALLYLTAPGFEWPDHVLAREIPSVMSGSRALRTIVPIYNEFVTLAQMCFPHNQGKLPLLDEYANRLPEFLEALEAWRASHSFERPNERVQVLRGRPDWEEVIADAQRRAAIEPDLQSFLPSVELEDVGLNSNSVTDMLVLYCGSRQPLRSLESAVNANNTKVFVEGEAAARHRYHLRLLEEVF